MSLIAGAWTLINSTGDINNQYPEDARLFYTRTGYVSAHILQTNPAWRPPHLDINKPDIGSDADWALLGKHNLAYSGPFDMTVLNGSEYDDGILTHHLDVANVPSLVGRRFVRNFTVMDGGKVLRLRRENATAPGVPVVIFWSRLE
ncbi:hypothetical protein P154DRAFT_581202 [Amniculicola lignicola CBS 123094]|uniref:Lipocalin-like domain-containing protein n=1 Tax=Amniculicola lignicola CBS 123094 TaxID=1392246 RepID=A0A6A5WBR3_9PLEO|nr:hypothetical protein P154DRAFT_581202 [Amniculicola lignicola CBS 123094]